MKVVLCFIQNKCAYDYGKREVYNCTTLVVVCEADCIVCETDCIEAETHDDVRICLTEEAQIPVEEHCALLISRAVEPGPVLRRPERHVEVDHVHEEVISERRVDVTMERPTAHGAGHVLLLELLHARLTRLVQRALAAHARELWEVVEANGALYFGSVHVVHGQTQDGKLRC